MFVGPLSVRPRRGFFQSCCWDVRSEFEYCPIIHFLCFTDPYNHIYSESSWHVLSTDAPVMTMKKTHTKGSHPKFSVTWAFELFPNFVIPHICDFFSTEAIKKILYTKVHACGEISAFSTSVMHRNLKFLHMTDIFVGSVTIMRYEFCRHHHH